MYNYSVLSAHYMNSVFMLHQITVWYVNCTTMIYWLSHFINCLCCLHGGTAAAAPPPFMLGNPALCGSHPLVTP